MRIAISLFLLWPVTIYAFYKHITQRNNLRCNDHQKEFIQKDNSYSYFSTLYGTRALRSISTRKQMSNIIFGERRLQSTEVLDDAVKSIKVSPPWNAPKWIWKWVWKFHAIILPKLHYFDRCAAKDNCVNLAVLWWKAIAGNRWGSRTYDRGIAFDFLPSITRRLVMFPLCWLYPNLHHQNVALRTIFLDEKVTELIDGCIHEDGAAPNVVVLGGGFDTRSLRLSMQYADADGGQNSTAPHLQPSFHEIDLPDVMQQKQCIFGRLLRRRSEAAAHVPKLIAADLNDLHLVKSQLESILFARSKEETKRGIRRSTIFVAEAVLLYLQRENILPLLNLCGKVATSAAPKGTTAVHDGDKVSNSSVWFAFADRIPYVMNDRWRNTANDSVGSIQPTHCSLYQQSNFTTPSEHPATLEAEHLRVAEVLRSVNWNLESCISKPGLARHMGHASYKQQPQ